VKNEATGKMRWQTKTFCYCLLRREKLMSLAAKNDCALLFAAISVI